MSPSRRRIFHLSKQLKRRDRYIYPKVCRFCANFSKRHRTAALRAAAATAIERISGYLDVCCAIEAAAARRAAVLWFRLRRPEDSAPYLGGNLAFVSGSSAG